MSDDERSGFPKLVSSIAVCGFALLAAWTVSLWLGPAQNWLRSLEDGLPATPSSQQRGAQAPLGPAWTDKEIETALMKCVQVLASVTADVSPLDPIRSGDCGTPAPVLVKSIGATDEVAFDPPLVLDCAMVVSLERWLRDSVQPAAKETFSSPVSKIVGSSYACRNVYHLPNGNLSQHAFANAVDLPIFVFADGRKVGVTHGWGPTQRDLIAAARAKKMASGVIGTVGQQKTEKKGAVSDVVKVSTSPPPSGSPSAGQNPALADDPDAVGHTPPFLRAGI